MFNGTQLKHLALLSRFASIARLLVLLPLLLLLLSTDTLLAGWLTAGLVWFSSTGSIRFGPSYWVVGAVWRIYVYESPVAFPQLDDALVGCCCCCCCCCQCCCFWCMHIIIRSIVRLSARLTVLAVVVVGDDFCSIKYFGPNGNGQRGLKLDNQRMRFKELGKQNFIQLKGRNIKIIIIYASVWPVMSLHLGRSMTLPSLHTLLHFYSYIA